MKRRLSHASQPVALVLCGGSGTRLRPITYLIRKEMLPVGRNRKPLLEFAVAHLRRHGIRDIVFLGSRAEGDDVANYFGDGHRFGVRIGYQPDHESCGGTGHALLWAVRKRKLEDRQLLVYYGDILTTVNLHELVDFHEGNNAAATLVLSEEYRIPKGIANLDETGRVISFDEKPEWKGPGKVGVGMLCLDGARLVSATGPLPATGEDLRRSDFKDIMGNVVPRLIARDRVAGYVTQAPWLDIGSFESYDRVREEVTWLTSEIEEVPVTRQGLAVFLSYHLTDANTALVDGLLAPCLKAAGMRVLSGGSLHRRNPVGRNPGQSAEREIDQADVVIAIATPDGPDRVPSGYVQHEVSFAYGRRKLLGLFVQKETEIPAPWKDTYLFQFFDRGDTGAFIKMVLETITRRR